MALHFFDIQSGRELFADEEGLDLPDQKAAKIEAMQTLVGMTNPRPALSHGGPIWTPSALIDSWQPALLLPGPVAALEAYVAAEMVIQFRAPCFEQTPLSASTQLTLAMRKHLLRQDTASAQSAEAAKSYSLRVTSAGPTEAAFKQRGPGVPRRPGP
jgi:hypothetical protein